MPARFLPLALALCLIGSCGAPSAPTTSGAPTTTSPGTTAAPTVTTAAPRGCGPGESPTEDGPVLAIAGPTSDSEQIGGIGWGTTVDCEVFTIAFTTDQGAPATTPPTVEAEMLRAAGVLRVRLGVEVTSIADQLVESALIEQIFVVRRSDRSLFIDFHLAAPALARIGVSGSPARVVVELEPGGGSLGAGPTIATNVVVVSPPAGPVEVPVIVSGYSRNFEANTVGRITQGGQVLAEAFTTAADWTETWGEFTLGLDPAGTGEAALFVGEQSPRDGSDRGVVIPIRLP